MESGDGRVLQFLLGGSFAFAQVGAETKTIEITVDDPRPMAAAILKLEELSGIPINYEDMPIYYAEDIRDITDEVARSPVPEGVRTLGRRRGQLSVPIVVDAATGRLSNIQAVNAALTAAVAAYNASEMPGDFDVEYYNGVFFVKPVQYRDATGVIQPMTPILSTLITLSEEKRTLVQTMYLIIRQVSAVTGVEIGLNVGRQGDMIIEAQNEPARYVIARMLDSGNGSAAAATDANWDVGLSYLLFCQPGSGCGLNQARSRPHNPNPGTPHSPPPPHPPADPGR